jgi:hypothetical protein
MMDKYTQFFAIDPQDIKVEVGNNRDVTHEIVKIFAENGSVGFIFLVLFLSAYFFDLSGFLKDAREGFKNLGRLADSVNKLTTDVERYQRQSNDDIHELNIGLNKASERLDKLSGKIDDLNTKITSHQSYQHHEHPTNRRDREA